VKPHSRIRKTIKWGGAAVTLLLVVVWIGSGWYSLWRMNPEGYTLGVIGGRAVAAHAPSAMGGFLSPTGWHFVRSSFSLQWSFSLESHPSEWYLRVPAWPVALLSAGATALAWRFDTLACRRARLNLCPKCHYDRAGLAAGAKCPECGAAQMSA
jgi:hypothetical protein